MHIKDAFRLDDVADARAIVRAHPFATIVTAGLRATHMPCLVDEHADGLAILSHVACADPAAEALDGPVLMVFHGPHGYVSASWYANDTIPTWNHVTLHVRGTPELYDDALPVLRRTVDHFEAAVEDPWSLDRMGVTAREMADQVRAFRLRADSWHAEARLSQDKPADEQARILAGLETRGPYANARLAAAMRNARDHRLTEIARRAHSAGLAGSRPAAGANAVVLSRQARRHAIRARRRRMISVPRAGSTDSRAGCGRISSCSPARPYATRTPSARWGSSGSCRPC